MLHSTTYARIATICDPRFNLSVFGVVLPSLSNDRCRQKLRLNMKECYTRYQQRAQAIWRSKLYNNPPLPNEDELSDAELYRSALAVLETEIELERYITQDQTPRNTNIYEY
jgi:hypothetical protein